jgi:hypothetical protein
MLCNVDFFGRAVIFETRSSDILETKWKGLKLQPDSKAEKLRTMGAFN